MLTHLLVPGVAGIRIDRIWREEEMCHSNVTTTHHAAQSFRVSVVVTHHVLTPETFTVIPT